MNDEEIRQYKQIIIIRSDLGIDCGKKCVQVAHASVMGADCGDEKITKMWRKCGMRKIVLKVPDTLTLVRTVSKAASLGIKSALVVDAGLTQLEPGTTTCVGFEPLLENSEKCLDLTALTSTLKLL
jgi:PTH2 family peptidyl-tRNA hydrolase